MESPDRVHSESRDKRGFGDWTAALAELSNRLDIGYRIFDRHGREFSKPY